MNVAAVILLALGAGALLVATGWAYGPERLALLAVVYVAGGLYLGRERRPFR